MGKSTISMAIPTDFHSRWVNKSTSALLKNLRRGTRIKRVQHGDAAKCPERYSGHLDNMKGWWLTPIIYIYILYSISISIITIIISIIITSIIIIGIVIVIIIVIMILISIIIIIIILYWVYPNMS